MKRQITSIQSLLLGLIFLLTMGFASDCFARDDSVRGKPGPAPSKVLQAPAGYCVSYGGSTSYESISSANLETLPGGTAMRLTVEVYIANPTGCTAGEPCPEYDDNPEYVNAWIDWDGDQQFEADEQVMDEAGTGYYNINYSGYMTFVRQFNMPEQYVENTWMRVNLGWGYDPGACESSWTWGNVLDQEVFLETHEHPKIKKITVSPDKPVTDKEVTLTAEVEEVEGYEIVEYVWIDDKEGDIGEGNPLTFTPQDGTHGRRTVSCTMTYQNLETEETGFDTMEYTYNLYFEKTRDNDGDGRPNWFEYWASDDAVPSLDASDVAYNATLSGYGRSWTDDDGTTHVEVSSDAATTHYSPAIVINAISFGGPTVKGIDCAAEVVAHEKKHNEISLKWITGEWKTKSSKDTSVNADFKAKGPGDVRDYNDKLEDNYEKTTTNTDYTKVDTYNVAGAKSAGYKYYGDNEYVVMVAANGLKGDATQDWAKPGKQAGGEASPPLPQSPSLSQKAPVYRSGKAGKAAPKASYRTEGMERALEKKKSEKSSTSPWGSITEQVIDENGNGLWDYLVLHVAITPPAAMGYNIVGYLDDTSGYEIAWASTVQELTTGTQTVQLRFSGSVIGASKRNGPYKLSRIELRTADDDYLVDFMDNAYTTNSYTYSAFEQLGATLGEGITDHRNDTNGNGKYDNLEVLIPFTVHTTGIYRIRGWLYSQSGETLCSASTSGNYAAGSHSASLIFDGRSLRQSRVNGPYHLRDLTLLDNNEVALDRKDNAYSTSAYPYTDFEGGSATFKSYSDTAVDSNSDGYFESLNVSIVLEVTQAGQFLITAKLVDSEGKAFSKASTQVDYHSLSVPSEQTVTLEFQGKDIFSNGVNGPYHLKEVTVVDSTGTLADSQSDAHVTQAYQYTSFKQPLVYATGTYSSEAIDSDQDGLYESLQISITVVSKDSGVVKAEGNLTDSLGNSIAWANNYTEVTAQVPAVITLTFDSNDIGQSGKNGPYYLRNLNIYLTGDPSQNDFVEEACSTSAYAFTQFKSTVTCTTWEAVIVKYQAYVGGQATWNDVIACYQLYAS